MGSKLLATVPQPETLEDFARAAEESLQVASLNLSYRSAVTWLP